MRTEVPDKNDKLQNVKCIFEKDRTTDKKRHEIKDGGINRHWIKGDGRVLAGNGRSVTQYETLF
ncbi:hypothetical protein [Superficieibacter sp.]|uniref:hypothetical protein n=1 Tax=Superficieibacter sp. TaxID=2303322 RepID=UPI0028B236B2|nr:hypothetical protein [Superficieibacter sp.]